jgi:hypothetical protein
MLIWIAIISAWLGAFEMSTAGYGPAARSTSTEKPADDRE